MHKNLPLILILVAIILILAGGVQHMFVLNSPVHTYFNGEIQDPTGKALIWVGVVLGNIAAFLQFFVVKQ